MQAHPEWPLVQATLDEFREKEPVWLTVEETAAALKGTFEGPWASVDGRTGLVSVEPYTEINKTDLTGQATPKCQKEINYEWASQPPPIRHRRILNPPPQMRALHSTMVRQHHLPLRNMPPHLRRCTAIRHTPPQRPMPHPHRSRPITTARPRIRSLGRTRRKPTMKPCNDCGTPPDTPHKDGCDTTRRLIIFDFARRLRFAAFDPGQIVGQRHDGETCEQLAEWAERALTVVVAEYEYVLRQAITAEIHARKEA